jgi:DNA-directed RNA polymerase specialized sigma24 family protein
MCISLDSVLEFYAGQEVSIAHLDHALRALEEVDVRQGQIVEMRFFGGLTIEEVAEALQISSRTVKREWLLAKIWLKRQLSLEQTSAFRPILAGGSTA